MLDVIILFWHLPVVCLYRKIEHYVQYVVKDHPHVCLILEGFLEFVHDRYVAAFMAFGRIFCKNFISDF